MGTGDSYNCATEIIGLELDILSEKVNFRVNVGQDRAKLSDIVPLARTICTKITDVVLRNIRSYGGQIPCCKGCIACCSHLIPLSVPEAFRLNEEISATTGCRRKLIWKTCLHAAHHILNQKPPMQLMPQEEEASQTSFSRPKYCVGMV